MADDKVGRDKQAHDAEDRRRTRALVEKLERMDGDGTAGPGVGPRRVRGRPRRGDGAEVVPSVGHSPIETADGTSPVADLVPRPPTRRSTPRGRRRAGPRPTVAAAMKRIVEAAATLPNATLGRSRRGAYERTFRELGAIDAADEDEWIEVVGDRIVGRIHGVGTPPDSRDVRREAATSCRASGCEIRTDEWPGVWGVVPPAYSRIVVTMAIH